VRGLCAAADAVVERADALFALTVAWLGAVAALLSLQMVLVFTHRPWLDEWQALQIALQSPSLADLLANLKYEGHPPLWYLLLRAAAVVTGPYGALAATAAVLAAVTQGAILFACPFSRAERLLLGSHCVMLFEFLTLSRSLTLGVAVLVLATALRRSRWAWAGIALLPMCDFLFGALSCVLVVLQWRDDRLWRPGVALWLASAALAAWTVIPAPDTVPALEHRGAVLDGFDYLRRAGLLLVPLQWGEHGPVWNGSVPLRLGGLLGILFFVFAFVQLRGDRLGQWLFWSFVGLTFVFTVAVYPLAARHLMLIALLLVLLVWRRAGDGVPPTGGFRTWLLAGAGCGMFVAAWNCAVPFDTADAAARAITRHGLADRHWMAFPESRAQGVSALTGITFERPQGRCMQTFVRWNFHPRLRDARQLAAYLDQEIAARGRFYLLSELPLATVLPPGTLRPIASIPAGYDDQEYHLFVIGPDRPESRVRLPLCVTDQRPLARMPLIPG